MTRTTHAMGPGDAASLAEALCLTLSEAGHWLKQIPVLRTTSRPRPGGWSSREIIGHLIDSASNNHGRFVRAALDDSMVFPTYDQEAWVALQRYQDEDWETLLARWIWLNDQVAATVQRIPDKRLTLPRREHNLDRIAWQTVAANEPVTLAWFIRDYIGHMRHHLAQIAALCEVNERDMRGSRCTIGPAARP